MLTRGARPGRARPGEARPGRARPGEVRQGGARPAATARQATARQATARQATARQATQRTTTRQATARQATARPASQRPAAGKPAARRPSTAKPAAWLPSKNSSRRLNATLLALAIVVCLIVARLVQLQVVDSGRYRALSHSEKLTTIVVPPVRGEITSSDGTVLAVTVQTQQVYADPPLITQSTTLANVASKLAGPLQMSQQSVLALLQHPTSPDYVLLKTVQPSTADQIASLGLPGVAFHPIYSRAYPNGDLAAGVLGFTNIDAKTSVITGQAGLEQSYNSLLSGQTGVDVFDKDAAGYPIPGTESVVRPSVPAGNLQLTIQADIQWQAEKQCALAVLRTAARTCTVVVMQPSTGAILALAQYPTFNPAAPTSYAATTDIPVANLFAPGSTAKVITTAAALEHGQTPTTSYVVPASIYWHGALYGDAEWHPTERYTIAGIIAHSLNDGMIQVADHVTPQQQYAMFRAFGIGSPSGLPLPADEPGLLPAPSQWTGGQRNERYQLSFGQSVSVTAVQMASVYATIANGGVRVTPTIVAGTTTSAGQFVAAQGPARRRVISTATANELMRILQQVPGVYSHAGEKWGIIPDFTVAAKTGTAQEVGRGVFGSSFIGIAPATGQGIEVAVNLQDPRRGSHFGIDVAGPVFNAVMRFALATMKIAPDGNHVPYVPLTVP